MLTVIKMLLVLSTLFLCFWQDTNPWPEDWVKFNDHSTSNLSHKECRKQTSKFNRCFSFFRC